MAERFEKAIAALARKQHGYVTREQLLALGVGRRAVQHWVAVGWLIPVYAVGHLPVGQEARAHAAVLVCGEGAVLSHGSAAGLWKYVKHWTPPLEVIATWDRRRQGIKVHRTKTLTRRDVTRQLGVPVTSPARTVFDMTPRLGSDAALRRFVNDARLTYTLHLSDLGELLARHPRHPSYGNKRPTDSPQERQFCALLVVRSASDSSALATAARGRPLSVNVRRDAHHGARSGCCLQRGRRK